MKVHRIVGMTFAEIRSYCQVTEREQHTVKHKSTQSTTHVIADTEFAARKIKAQEVTRRLVEHYGHPRWSDKDPLSMLVEILLSHRTHDATTAAAYRALIARFANWEALRDAPVATVQATIAKVTFPEVKAARIQAILRQITEERGSLNLDFLCALSLEEAMAWLARLKGVGQKTIGCVLLFSCRKPIMPVDTHVHRISIRLGLIGPRVKPEAAYGQLLALFAPDDAQGIFDFHRGLVDHGQRICVFDKPRCTACFLQDQCKFYATFIEGKPRSER